MVKSSKHLIFKSLFKPRNPKPFSSQWPWPSCNQPKTLSFRLTVEQKLVSQDSTDSCITNSSSTESESFSIASDSSVEAAMQAVSSNRLLFDGKSDNSSSIVGNKEVKVPFEGSVAVEVESKDLHRDFLASMKEIVEANGEVKKDLVWFEEMLEWYLRMNKKTTHEFIIGAYWDLLLEMMASSYCSTSATLSSCSSSTCSSLSSYFSCLCEIQDVVKEEEEKIK